MRQPNWTFRDTVSELTAGLDYTLDKSGGNAGFTEGNSGCEIIYFVRTGTDQNIITHFVDDLLGYSSWDYGTGDPPIKLNRVLPDRHPIWRNFYCTKVSVDTIGGKSIASHTANVHPAPQQTLYKVSAYYEPVDFHVLADSAVTKEYQRFIRVKYRNTTNMITMTGSFKFVTSGRVLAHPPAKVEPTKILTLTWLRVPAYGDNPFKMPTEQYDIANLGRLNNGAWYGYRPKTLLYLGAEDEVVLPAIANDVYYHNISFNFAIKDVGTTGGGDAMGHNYLFDLGSNTYDLVTHNGLVGGNRIYPEDGEFDNLFLV